jgi:hypothetical protein
LKKLTGREYHTDMRALALVALDCWDRWGEISEKRPLGSSDIVRDVAEVIGMTGDLADAEWDYCYALLEDLPLWIRKRV